ncbi:MAG: HypC/HybG/HupF family hydrogenase formation chaperone [Nanoarchaeota archaeon]
MCLAIPGMIIEINDGFAMIDYGKEKRKARLLDEDIKVGDYVVVQNKLVLQSIQKDQALESIKLWKQAFSDEN